jgi:hypothetical protein
VLSNTRKGSAKGILFLFKVSCSESVEQISEFLAERAKYSEAERYEGSTVGVDER